MFSKRTLQNNVPVRGVTVPAFCEVLYLAEFIFYEVMCLASLSSMKSYILRSFVFYEVLYLAEFCLLQSPVSRRVLSSTKSSIPWACLSGVRFFSGLWQSQTPVGAADSFLTFVKRGSIGVPGSLLAGPRFSWTRGCLGLPQHSFSP